MSETAPPCELRPPSEADRDAIAEVWHASASLPDVGPAILPTETQLRQWLDQEFASGWVVTLAIRHGEIAGFVAFRPQEAVLAELFVRPDLLGNGLGRVLLAHAMARMADGFSLYTRTANAGARRFYERAGLTVLRQDTHPRTGDPVTHYRWTPATRLGGRPA